MLIDPDIREDFQPDDYWPKYTTIEGGDWDERLTVDLVQEWIDEVMDIPEVEHISSDERFYMIVDSIWDENRQGSPIDENELLTVLKEEKWPVN